MSARHARASLLVASLLAFSAAGNTPAAAEDAASARPVRLEALSVHRSSESGFLEVGVAVRNDFDRRVCGRVVLELLGEDGEEVLGSRILDFRNLVSGEVRRLEGRVAAGPLDPKASYRIRVRLRAATPLLPGASAPASHADVTERTFVPEELADKPPEP